MTQIIINMVNGCQSEGTIDFYFNGFEFTTSKCSLKGTLANHFENAKNWLKENAGIAYLVIFQENNPTKYNFRSIES